MKYWICKKKKLFLFLFILMFNTKKSLRAKSVENTGDCVCKSKQLGNIIFTLCRKSIKYEQRDSVYKLRSTFTKIFFTFTLCQSWSLGQRYHLYLDSIAAIILPIFARNGSLQTISSKHEIHIHVQSTMHILDIYLFNYPNLFFYIRLPSDTKN